MARESEESGFNILPLLLVGVLLYLALGQQGGCTLDVGPVGPKTILVAYEAGNSTSDFADLNVDFQNGPIGKPFKDKGHTVIFLDNDTQDLSGQLAAPLKPFAPFDDAKPEVIVSSGGKLLFREPLTYSTSAESLAAILTKKGL